MNCWPIFFSVCQQSRKSSGHFEFLQTSPLAAALAGFCCRRVRSPGEGMLQDSVLTERCWHTNVPWILPFASRSLSRSIVVWTQAKFHMLERKSSLETPFWTRTVCYSHLVKHFKITHQKTYFHTWV